MNHKLKKFRSRAMFTVVGGMIVVNPAFAQDAQDATQLDAVQVTGLRSSLDQAMNIKRDSAGIVDAVSAEDIGKFPDTNLAESLQRITGISIERRDGEGAQVTARGFGPQFNMVTLNGRQVPGADAFGSPGQVAVGGVDGGTRAFNFAQLASEAVSGLEVYKTGQAHVPSGGIGATINILTARPFNNRGGEVVASAGVKGVYDKSQPFGTDITPEVSGIFSYANPDKTWGISLSASQQKRRAGSTQATENAWNVQEWTGSMPGNPAVVNAPEVGELYARPNDIRYAFSDFQRERVNAQAVLQFAPNDDVVFTLDYTHSTNEITEKRGEMGMWLQNDAYTHVEFDRSGAIATPVYIREISTAGSSPFKDFGMEQQRNAQKYEFNQIGLNVDWRVNDSLRLSFDAHNSKTESKPNDPLTGGGALYVSVAGTNNCVGTGAPNCGGHYAQELRFNNGLPIGTRTWYPTLADAQAGTNGQVNPPWQEGQVGSQVLRINAQRQESEIKQGRIDGEWVFDDGRFQFGVDSSTVTLRQQNNSENFNTLGNWSVDNVASDVQNGLMDLLTPYDVVGMFDDFSAPGAFRSGFRGNAGGLAEWARDVYGSDIGLNPILNTNSMVEEKTHAAYFQVDLEGQLAGRPVNTRLGLRYETTDVEAVNVVANRAAINWQSNNDFQIKDGAPGDATVYRDTNSYSYILPNLDFSIDFTDTLKGRASFGRTIARAPFTSLAAGPGNVNRPNGSVLLNESSRGSADAQNTKLRPLESNNVDLALEWYFADASYLSATYWNKSVNNFLGTAVERGTMYDLTDPTSGPDALAALAFLDSADCVAQVQAAGGNPDSACAASDTNLFTALAMLRNATETGGLAAYNGSQALEMESRYDIEGLPTDPLYEFNISRPVNQHTAKLNGWELAGQYFFGDTGFGIYANYTIVNGDVGFNNASIAEQFALLGLSDTANLMLMYEKYGWSARLAWNWRDEYLILSNQDDASHNPYYVEEYDQIDLSVTYQLDDQWAFSLEAINLTGEDVRWHGRTGSQIVRLVDQAPRYMLGVRYKF